MSIRGREGRARRDRLAAHTFAAVALLSVVGTFSVLLAVGCRAPAPVDARLRERIVLIEGPTLVRLLERAATLRGTPAAGHAESLLAHARGCDEIWGHVTDPTGFQTDAFRCLENGDDTDLIRFVREQRGEAQGFVSGPIGADGAFGLRITAQENGAMNLVGELIPPSETGAAGLFMPGDEPPADAILDPSTALIHARARPAEGLRLARLVPTGGQAEQLFALKGRLLEGALLEGTWELAFLAPAQGGALPLAVGALHHRLEAGIREALSEALDQLESTWPIERSARHFQLADGTRIEGGCFEQLPLLPELAPCWVVTPRALLIGYRARAIELALAPPAVSSAPSTSIDGSVTANGIQAVGAQLDVHFDRLKAADAHLLGADLGPHPGDHFERFELRSGLDATGRLTVVARLRVDP